MKIYLTITAIKIRRIFALLLKRFQWLIPIPISIFLPLLPMIVIICRCFQSLKKLAKRLLVLAVPKIRSVSFIVAPVICFIIMRILVKTITVHVKLKPLWRTMRIASLIYSLKKCAITRPTDSKPINPLLLRLLKIVAQSILIVIKPFKALVIYVV